MKQDAPTPSRTIQITTALYGAILLAVVVTGFFQPIALIAGAILLLAGLYCYWFWSPVAYELRDGALIVFFRASRKRFESVTSCSLVEQSFPVWTSLRLCGNGGLFAASGIFWNKRYGVFRAYVTRHQPHELVLVETRRQRIIISPENPQTFVQNV